MTSVAFAFHNLLYAFLGLFVALDIIGILPMYMGLTQSLDKKSRKRIAKDSIFVAAGVAFLFAYIGQYIFRFLGISIHDFKVGGGIVLLVISIMEIIGPPGADRAKGSTGIVPIAVPLITGPAVITTVMLQVSLYGYLIVSLSLLLNFALAWVAIQKSSLITRLIGESGTEIVSKMAALLLTAIAFAMIRTGVVAGLKL